MIEDWLELIKDSVIIDAILIQDITYKKDDAEYLIKKGTLIKIDVENSIALVNNDHIHINKIEYQVFI